MHGYTTCSKLRTALYSCVSNVVIHVHVHVHVHVIPRIHPFVSTDRRFLPFVTSLTRNSSNDEELEEASLGNYGNFYVTYIFVRTYLTIYRTHTVRVKIWIAYKTSLEIACSMPYCSIRTDATGSCEYTSTLGTVDDDNQTPFLQADRPAEQSKLQS